METSIELGYAGVVIGRVTVSGGIDESGLFLPIPDPLPVGTRLNLKIDGRAAEARVISVQESAEPGKAGMRVRIGAVGATPVAESRAAAAETRVAVAESRVAVAESRTAVAESPAPVAESPAPVGESPAAIAESPAAATSADAVPESADAQAADSGGDGIPSADETAGNSGAVGGGGGGRRKRRRR